MAATLNLERIYVKDISFESPQAPEVFRKPWKPQVKFDLNTGARPIENAPAGEQPLGVDEAGTPIEARHEVNLRVTLTAKDEDDQTLLIVEVTQSGIFASSGFEEEQLRRVLATMCPNILFPYVREQVDSLMVKGGFPAAHLAPVNFEAVYAQAAQAQAQANATDNPSH